jgi:hypothetical protein
LTPHHNYSGLSGSESIYAIYQKAHKIDLPTLKTAEAMSLSFLIDHGPVAFIISLLLDHGNL